MNREIEPSLDSMNERGLLSAEIEAMQFVRVS
jgi:hypothetical protein